MLTRWLLLLVLLLTAPPAHAVVNEVVARNDYIAGGVNLAFPYTFRILAKEDVLVYVNAFAQTVDTHYSVTGLGDSGGGTVLFVTAPPASAFVTLLRRQAISQASVYQPNEAFPSGRLERDLDKQTMVNQQQQEEIGRALKFPKTSFSKDITVAEPSAGLCWAWNATNTGTVNVVCGTGGGGTPSGGNVTTSATLGANRLLLGNGGVDITAMNTLGLGATVLHGNASGAPTFGPLSFTGDAFIGALPALNFPALTGDITNVAGTLATVLKDTGTTGTYTKVTTDVQGRVSAGAAATLASSDFANQGTTTTVLHGNAAGNPAFAGISIADHTATGTPSATTFLRGDNTWATPPGTGTVTASGTLTANAFITGAGTTVIQAVPITGLVLGNGASAPAAYAGSGACSAGDFITAISATGVKTCATPAGSGTVTATAGALTANAVMLGAGGTDSKVLASLGTTTTLLHGNAAGAPTFAGVSIADHTATGTPSASTFLRGDNTWSAIGAITSLNGLTGATQTFGNDTNVTVTSTGTTHTIGWTGTLSSARGGTGVNFGATTGVPTITAGTWSSTPFLLPAFGGTGQNVPSDDAIMVGDGTNWAKQTLPNCANGLTYTTGTNAFGCLGAAAVNGVGASGRVSFWSGVNTESSDATFLWDNTAKRLEVTGAGGFRVTSVAVGNQSFVDGTDTFQVLGGSAPTPSRWQLATGTQTTRGGAFSVFNRQAVTSTTGCINRIDPNCGSSFSVYQEKTAASTMQGTALYAALVNNSTAATQVSGGDSTTIYVDSVNNNPNGAGNAIFAASRRNVAAVATAAVEMVTVNATSSDCVQSAGGTDCYGIVAFYDDAGLNKKGGIAHAMGNSGSGTGKWQVGYQCSSSGGGASLSCFRDFSTAPLGIDLSGGSYSSAFMAVPAPGGGASRPVCSTPGGLLYVAAGAACP